LKSNLDNENNEEINEIKKLNKVLSHEPEEQDIIVDEDKEKGSVSFKLY